METTASESIHEVDVFRPSEDLEGIPPPAKKAKEDPEFIADEIQEELTSDKEESKLNSELKGVVVERSGGNKLENKGDGVGKEDAVKDKTVTKETVAEEISSQRSAPERQQSQDYEGDSVNGRSREEISRIRKKKVALLISYCGAGYFGMQKNPGVKTIEEELLAALSKTGAIKDEVKDDFGKMSFQRCARTDKGVSASRQVVSLKMVPVKELLPLINDHLPPSIRVFGMIRVTKGFDSKNQCSARTYQYLTPTFAFAPTEMQTVPSYRIKAQEIERVNSILKLMCGTHNFHNYTSGKHADEASAKRYIIEFSAGSPFVKKGHEFIAISVKGQSFMLHQIRKMIGVCIAICKGFCNEDIIERSWGKNKMDIPKAPGLGLILDMVHFDRYNQRYGSDGLHELISWEGNKEEVEQFKESFIWDTIIESEITLKSMSKWLMTLKNHTYSENKIQSNSNSNSNTENES